MKPAYLKMIFISLLIVTSLSCSKSSNKNSTSCNFSYTGASQISEDQQVQYFAGVTGSATISNVSYQDSAGTTTVKNPVLPWSVKVNLTKGATTSITANGSAPSGTEINISVYADGSQVGTSCP
ncbi:MAG TPA: MmpS family transport accessory protein [Puia sp.]|nr:MmpS family transport accessory protein [Puia sp.]